MWIFFLVKGTELSLKIYQEGVLHHPDRHVGWEDRLYQCIDVLGSSIYFLILFFYAKSLAQAQGDGDGGDEEYHNNYYKSGPEVDDDVAIQKKKKQGKLLRVNE